MHSLKLHLPLITLILLTQACGTNNPMPADELTADDINILSRLQPTASGLATCPEPSIDYPLTDSGIPLIETNPGAPIALYLDFDGGIYGGSTQLSGFNRRVEEGSDGDPNTFDDMERADIKLAVERTDQYFAMFDVNVTTDPAARDAADAWGWIIITEDSSGGQAHLSSSSISRLTYAKAFVSAARSRAESANKGRSLASEFGHNFHLHHQGEYEDGVFDKRVRSSGFDGNRGAVMGGGGGIVNGWLYGHHDGDNGDVTFQDDIAIIRERILITSEDTYSGDGFRPDDHDGQKDASATSLCLDESGLWQQAGIIERRDDKDVFAVNWGGGDMHVTAQAVDVSAVDLVVRVYDEQLNLVKTVNSPSLTREYGVIADLYSGYYYFEVASRGGYGELGKYQLTVHDESLAPPSKGAIYAQIDQSDDDAEEDSTGDMSMSSSDLEMVTDSLEQVVGLRFNDIKIPQGALINSAYIQFQTDETGATATDLVFHAEASPSATSFTRSNFDLSSRVKTTAFGSWQPQSWNIKGERDLRQRTTDIANVIQEVIDQSEWVPGNSMALFISGTGKRTAESFNGDQQGAPLLVIQYGYDPEELLPGDHPDDDIELGDEPLPEIQTLTLAVIASKDDAEERGDGYVSRSSSDLELVRDDSDQYIGLRFQNLTLPVGAQIDRAYIQFVTDEPTLEETHLVIAAEYTGQAAEFSSQAYGISQRWETSVVVNWSPDTWGEKDEALVQQQSPDLTSLINEVISHPEWVNGNPIVFIISGGGKRVAHSFNKDPLKAPKLVIDYHTD